MVSIRRRKLLGLCSGRNSFLAPLPRFSDIRSTSEYPAQNTNPVSVHPMPSADVKQPTGNNVAKVGPGSSNASGSSSPKEMHNQQFSGQDVKKRKRHRRKHVKDHEPCLMRGVYFKNSKWQAAIKVDKKQIHLGTVGSQEEAARLYDRAAFMCGREPNFELSEEEKQELRQFKWDEFLAMTRHAITNKKYHRRNSAGLRRRSEPQLRNSDDDREQGTNSFSEDVELDTY